MPKTKITKPVKSTRSNKSSKKVSSETTTLVLSKPLAQSAKNYLSSFNFKSVPFLVGAGVLALALLLYLARGLFVAAIVNGQPISRWSVVSEMEQQYGKPTINSLVTKTLILQEAKKQNITISDQEVNNEIKKIEENIAKQGQNFDELLKAQNLTREKLREQIRLEKLIQKMVGKDIVITDKEVEDYIANNKDSFPADANQEELKPAIKQQLEQQKLSEKFQGWLEELQKKANIHYLVNY